MKLHFGRKFRIILIIAAVLLLGFVVTGIVVNHSVNKEAEGRCYSNVNEIPYRRVGLLLGTARVTRQGYENPYFYYRTDACAELYHAGKIHRVLISGDNSRKDYNEPLDMMNELVSLGVPADSITLDYAGFRTYDSMVRAKKVFGQDSVTVISQDWHNERAIYIANRVDVDAIAFNARDVSIKSVSLKLKVREWLARTKMAIDLLFQHDPHFLGEPIVI